jgi:transcriptional regulator with XRE-family HTH domain
MATKAENEKKKELAHTLFMSGLSQEEIADKVGVSRVSVSKWCNAEGWKEARAARNITRPELVNKLLLTIDKLIEQVSQSDDVSQMAGLGDKLSKLASVIQKLDKQANVVDAIEVFMAFNRWLEYRATTDSDITPELIKAINKYQDKFLGEAINRSSLN